MRADTAEFVWGPGALSGNDGRFRIQGVVPGEHYVFAASYALNPATRLTEPNVPAIPFTRGGVKLAYVTTVYRSEGAPTRTLTPIKIDQAEVEGIDILLARRPVFEIRGTVSGAAPDHLPSSVSVTLIPGDPDTLPFGRRVALASGRFVAGDLPDGTYEVTVIVQPTVHRTRVVIAGRHPRPISIVAGSVH